MGGKSEKTGKVSTGVLQALTREKTKEVRERFETIEVSADFKKWWDETIWSKAALSDALIVCAWQAWEYSRYVLSQELENTIKDAFNEEKGKWKKNLQKNKD